MSEQQYEWRSPDDPTDAQLAEMLPEVGRFARYGMWAISQPSPVARLVMTREEFCERWPWEDPDANGLPIEGAER